LPRLPSVYSVPCRFLSAKNPGRLCGPARSNGCWRCWCCGPDARWIAPGSPERCGRRARRGRRGTPCATPCCICARPLGSESARLQSSLRDTLHLDLDGTEVDVVRFDRAIAAEDVEALREAVALYKGPLLEGSKASRRET